MRRADLDAFAGWGRHTDPLSRHYDPRVLAPAEADELWRFLAGAPHLRRPYVAQHEGRVVASLLVRDIDPSAASGEIGIVLDPSLVGRGLGRRILSEFATVLASEGFRHVTLEVVAFNRRAIAAYRAAGFVETGERWGAPEPGLDVGALLEGPSSPHVRPHVRPDAAGRTFEVQILQMERRLSPTRNS